MLKVKVVWNYQPVRLLLSGGFEGNCWKLVAQILEPLLHILLRHQIFTHTTNSLPTCYKKGKVNNVLSAKSVVPILPHWLQRLPRR